MSMELDMSAGQKGSGKMAEDGQSKFAKFGQAFVAGGWTMYPVLLLLIIVGSFIAPRFLSFINVVNILHMLMHFNFYTGPGFKVRHSFYLYSFPGPITKRYEVSIVIIISRPKAFYILR